LSTAEKMLDVETLLYNRFLSTIRSYGLVPEHKRKVFVFYSGGKDASVLADLFLKFKSTERPDLEISLVTVLFPEIIYKPSDPVQLLALKKAVDYWKNKGFDFRFIDLPLEVGDHLFEDNETPCETCESVKTNLIFKELSLPHYEGSLVCMAHSLDDIMGYLSEIQLIAGAYNTWQEISTSDPQLFERVLVLAKRVYPRYQPQNLGVTYIKPLIELNEALIREYVVMKGIPLVPECCAEKRGPRFRIYKRTVMEGLNWLEKRYRKETFSRNFVYKNYQQVIDFYKRTGLLPAVEDIEARVLQSGI
jgi:tRNA(Ile)-lysidine synthase TilS/MesJ